MVFVVVMLLMMLCPFFFQFRSADSDFDVAAPLTEGRGERREKSGGQRQRNFEEVVEVEFFFGFRSIRWGITRNGTLPSPRTSAAMKSNAARTAASASFTVSPDASAAAEATSFMAARGRKREGMRMPTAAEEDGPAEAAWRGLEHEGVDKGARRRDCIVRGEMGRDGEREGGEKGARERTNESERERASFFS